MEQPSLVIMKESYPFGDLKEAPPNGQTPLVCKRIAFSGQEELEILERMAGLMGKLKHEHLIGVERTDTPSEHQFLIFYEYVPLTLQKWVLDLGDQFLEDLQFQMLSLANFLTQQNIKFTFEPNCLGLDQTMRVKYFLHQFQVDPKNKMANFKVLEGQISSFFREFKEFYSKSSENSTEPAERKSADAAMVPTKLGLQKDRGSWEVGKPVSEKGIKSELSEKIESSKKKSMEVLMRLKGLKPKSEA